MKGKGTQALFIYPQGLLEIAWHNSLNQLWKHLSLFIMMFLLLYPSSFVQLSKQGKKGAGLSHKSEAFKIYIIAYCPN